MSDDILGIKGIKAGNLSAGVGFIIIPQDIDPDQYKKDVYRTGMVSIYGGYGHSNFYNIHIDKEVLQDIEFPEKSGILGTPVVWINIPKHNSPIIIASLKQEKEILLFGENRKRITKKIGESLVEIDLDANKSKLSISVKGDEENDGIIELKVNSITDDGKLKIDINGSIFVHSTDKFISVSENSIQNAVTDMSGTVVAFTKLTNNEDGFLFHYKDKFDNEITIEDGKINIVSEKIQHNNGEEPMLLGNKTIDFLSDLISAIEKMTFANSAGVTGTTINSVEFKNLKNKVKQLKSEKSWLD